MGEAERPTRDQAERLLERYPGLHMREVARQLDVDVRTAKHHLDRLEKDGRLSAIRLGGRKRYFPRRAPHEGEVVDRRDKAVLARLRVPVELDLVLRLALDGPARLAELAEGAEVSPSLARYHLAKLEGAGVVDRPEEGGYRLREPDRIRHLLRTWRPTPDQVDGLLELWKAFTEGE